MIIINFIMQSWNKMADLTHHCSNGKQRRTSQQNVVMSNINCTFLNKSTQDYDYNANLTITIINYDLIFLEKKFKF